MPNHITNILDVTGPLKEIIRFKKTVCHFEVAPDGTRERIFDFNMTVTMPKELNVESSSNKKMLPVYKANIAKFGYKDWFDWNIAKWGTKWNSFDLDKLKRIPNGSRFRFDTASTPPSVWIVTTAKLFPSLKFKDTWFNEGGTAGILTVKNDDASNKQIPVGIWLMEFNKSYIKEYKFITKGSYKKVVESFTASKAFLRYESLEEHLLKRIKDIDLPRFLNYQWCSLNVEKEFEKRIKNAPIGEL